MPRKAADPKYTALARRVTALEKLVTVLVKALEDEADEDSGPMEDLSGNRIERRPAPHPHESL